MFDFTISADSKAVLYEDLLKALAALIADEPDAIANMANVSALLWQTLPDLNWAGFYRVIGGELVLPRKARVHSHSAQ
jgi:L-methionine (R)-S-oxide reductase